MQTLTNDFAAQTLATRCVDIREAEYYRVPYRMPLAELCVECELHMLAGS